MHAGGFTCLAAFCAALIGSGGCDHGAAASNPEALPQPTTHVVIFLIDTLRADKVRCYGYDKPTSPTIDALASEGVLFRNAQAPAPWTCPSVPSIMTSTFLCEHGVTSELKKLSPQIKTIAERFKQIDYHTASFFTNTFAGETTGMDRGFDTARFNPNGQWYVDGAVIDQWAGDKPDGPFFLYVHNIEPHNPFQAPPRLARQFGDSQTEQARQTIGQMISMYRPMLRPDWGNKGPIRPLGTTDNEAKLSRIVAQLDKLLAQHHALYDAVVRQADERLASVIASLKKTGEWDNTLFIVLSDHGEELSERGDYLHSQSVYGELTNVPLIVKFPKNQYAGTVVNEVVALVDVVPTVFDYLKRPDLADGARGQSLMPMIRGELPQPHEFVVTTLRINEKKDRKHWAPRGNINVAVQTRDGQWKGIWNVEKDTFELYNRAADSVEAFNQCGEQSGMTDAMFAFVKEWYETCGRSAKTAGEGQLSAEALDALGALGYVGGEVENDDSDPSEDPATDEPAARIVETVADPCPVPVGD